MCSANIIAGIEAEEAACAEALAPILALHPLPWHVGECHETMARVHDANGNHVFTVNDHNLVSRKGANAYDKAEALCKAVNLFQGSY
jgi:hypothetical protein